MTDLIVGIAIALVIEGLIYAAFPNQVKAMLAEFLNTPSSTLRAGGLFVLALGVFIVWLVRG